MEQKKLISIVIPVYNGAETIKNLVEKIISVMKNRYQIEIILVNDYSTDSSEDVCFNLYQQHNHIVKFYSLAKNVGEHNAVMAGLNYSNGDYVVIMDDDFQNPPDEILTLINHAIKHDYDVVYSYYNQKEHSLFRNIGSWFNGIIANIMLDKPSELYLSSFKVLNRFIVNEVIRYSSPFIYIDGIIFQITSNIGKIEVKHNKRVIGKSNYTMKKLFLLWLNMFLSFSILPLRMSAFLGSIISCFGLIYAFIAIIEKFVNAELISGWTSLIVIISIFSGAQLMCIGVIGEYVGRIFISLNHKPQFTVRRGYSDEH